MDLRPDEPQGPSHHLAHGQHTRRVETAHELVVDEEDGLVGLGVPMDRMEVEDIHQSSGHDPHSRNSYNSTERLEVQVGESTPKRCDGSPQRRRMKKNQCKRAWRDLDAREYGVARVCREVD